MTYESPDSIDSFLHDHGEFAECILRDVRWRHFGTVIEVDLQVVRTPSGQIIDESEKPLLMSLRFHNVQELRLENAMTEDMALQPRSLDWGISEIAMIRRVANPDVMARYAKLPIPVHLVRFSWEGDRCLEVAFSTLEALTI